MANRQELLYEAFETGNLEYQVEEYQLPVYRALWKAILEPYTLKFVCNIARRFGKTHTTSIVAVEFAIRYPGSIINYAAPTDKEMKKILRSIYPVILQECPENLKPKRVNGTWEFPNGSIIYTAGVNNGNADNLRGNKADLNIIDEAGQVDELKYLMDSVLLPQQLTTGGTMLLLSTPPSVVDHDYSVVYHEAKENNNVVEFTVYDNAKIMADPKLLDTFVRESGGKESTAWLREYECKFVTDTNKIILPEWALFKEQNTIARPKPEVYPYLLKYVGMDLGFKHNTCLIFGYYDFERAKLVIEHEEVLNDVSVTSAAIADVTTKSENTLWGVPFPKTAANPMPQPGVGRPQTVSRISDNNMPILLNDIALVHNVTFHPTSKDELMAMVNKTRAFIGAGKLEVHPDCKYLLGCLEYGVWDKNRKEFAESKKFGHYDGLAALIYVLRYVDEFTNPIPADFGLNRSNLAFPIGHSELSKNAQGLSDLSRINKRRTLRGAA